MARFKSEIRTGKSPEELTKIITGYLSSKGYAEKDKEKNEWRKGLYWTKFVKFAVSEGTLNLEAWINVPLAGMGSYIKYFMGRSELKNMVAEMETSLADPSFMPPSDWQSGAVSGAVSAASFASFPARVGALLLDSVFLGVFMSIIAALATPLFADSSNLAASMLTGGFVVVPWLYFALQESSSVQATWGKRILGIQVCDLPYHRISFARATGRAVVKVLSMAFYGIAFLPALFTQKKQAVHDLLCGTVVVNKTRLA